MLKKFVLLLSASLLLLLMAYASAPVAEKDAGDQASPGAMYGCLIH